MKAGRPTALQDPAALSAIKLTLLVAAISLPLNTIFGLAASWAIAKFEFKGKAQLLIALIDMPFCRVACDLGIDLCVSVWNARMAWTYFGKV